MSRRDDDTKPNRLPDPILVDFETARESIADAIRERLDPAATKRRIAEYMNRTLAPFHNQQVTPRVLETIRVTVAQVLQEYVRTLAMRGFIPEDQPIPMRVGDVTVDPAEPTRLSLTFHVDPVWMDSLPPEVQEEIVALMSAGTRRNV